MNISVEIFIKRNVVTGGYSKLLKRDYKKFGFRSTDMFSKRILCGDYGYDCMKKFRDYVYENVTIQPPLRMCIVKDKLAYFHTWSFKSNVIEPSPLVGGHSGGVISYTVGIVEFEDGRVRECLPPEIRFIENYTEYINEKREKNNE